MLNSPDLNNKVKKFSSQLSGRHLSQSCLKKPYKSQTSRKKTSSDNIKSLFASTTNNKG